MLSSLNAARLRRLGSGLALSLATHGAWAQATPAAHGYDFLTVTAMESTSKSFARVLITPPFQGRSEAPLEDYSGMGVEKLLDKIQRNTQIVNQQLSDVTAAGWELVEAHVIPVVGIAPATTRYLFRKPKP